MPITFDQLSSEQKEVCIRYIQNTGTFAFELNDRLRNNAIQGEANASHCFGYLTSCL